MGRISNFYLIFAIISIITTEFACNGDANLTHCLDSNREALIEFRNGLKDPENRLSSWHGSNCCQWWGIRCDNRTGAVAVIDLHHPNFPPSYDYATEEFRYEFWNLSGEIRSSLLKLESLTYLDLSYTTFQDIPIPEFFGSLKSLRYLNLSNAGFSGIIPPNLGNLSSLIYLDVSSEFNSLSIDNLQWMTGLVSLKHLEINRVNLSLVGSSWVEVLNTFPFLTELHLSGCSLSGSISSPSSVNFTALEVVDLRYNSFNSKFPDWLANLTSLVHVDISARHAFMSNSGLRGRIPLGLGELPSLQYLNLKGNMNLRASCFELFRGSWRKIEVLNFGVNQLHGKLPSSIGNMTFLAEFDLHYCNVEGGIPSSIGRLCNLKYFDLSGNNLTGSLPELLEGTGDCVSKSPLPSLLYLTLSSNRLIGKLPEWLGHLENLVELDLGYNLLGSLPELLEGTGDCVSKSPLPSLLYLSLRNNRLIGKLPEWLGHLENLVELDLGDNLLGSLPELLEGTGDCVSKSPLPSLLYLRLSNNRLIGKLPEWLGHLENLVELDLGNNLLGSLPELLEGTGDCVSKSPLPSLLYLRLSNNRLIGKLPEWLGHLENLVELDLGDNLLGSLPELLEGTGDCASKSPLPSLLYLRLSNNRLIGKLPEWLGHLENLVELELGDNLLGGPIPASLGTLQNLTYIELGGNGFTGSLPDSFGKLSELSHLDISSNHLTGTISEVHFAKLSKLERLVFSSNSFILNVSSNWVPPFQVGVLHMSSCHLGPSFPTWLESQRELSRLDLSNASISGSIPAWFWDITSNLFELNVSRNQLRGQLPNPLNVTSFFSDFSFNLFEGPIPHSIGRIGVLDLSNNQFSGPIPQNISESKSALFFLSISNNQLTGQIPSTICEMCDLVVINLSWNNLTGNIPSSIGNCSFLNALDLGNNSLSGVIPNSLGQLKRIQSLHLNDNMLSGKVPCSFMNLSILQTLDLGNNYLSGNILSLFGESFTDLRILRLRWNAFSGGIPTELSHLTSLQVLDLAHNNLTGSIPVGLGDLKAVAQENKVNQYLLYGYGIPYYYEETLVVNLKGLTLTYTKTLSLVTSIDLSENNLNGDFPVDITKLSGLVALNLSSNQISGRIPENISSLRQLSSLDLSSNKLSGPIPPSMPSLTFLGCLNLSDNNFSGAIPYTGQMTTFTESAYAGNPGLCGPPLDVKCPGEDSYQPKNVENENGDVFIDKWFYLSVGLGFAVGLLAPYLIIATRKSWSEAYFSFVDKIVYRLPCVRYRRGIRKW